MHAGFAELRRELPFDAGRPPAAVAINDAAQAQVARIRDLWREARLLHGQQGPWLFGSFGIVDAMYAPVALRFQQYAIEIDGPERQYCEAVVEHHAVEAWVESVRYAPGREGTT